MIRNNRIDGGGIGFFGISLHEWNGSTIEGNEVTGLVRSAYVVASFVDPSIDVVNHTVRGNQCSNVGFGIILGSVADSEVSGNTVRTPVTTAEGVRGLDLSDPK